MNASLKIMRCLVPLLAILALLAGTLSCSKKAPPPPPAPVAPPPVVEAPLVPGTEFPDPDLQARYEAKFKQLAEDFDPPATGTLLAVKLADGSFIGGSLAKLNPTGIVLKLGKQDFVASRDDLDPAAQADLYKDAFARQYGVAEINATLSTNLHTVPTRYALKETLDTLTGPGPRYPRVADLVVQKGSRLDIQKRRGRWLLATAPTVKPGVTFWTDYFQTIPLSEDLTADYSPFVMLLLENGVLSRINPAESEAFVNPQAWAGTETSVQEGISRLLATHCAQVKQSTVLMVDIKADGTNQRLARYSRAQGFRSY